MCFFDSDFLCLGDHESHSCSLSLETKGLNCKGSKTQD